jgi:hypothetical protein
MIIIMYLPVSFLIFVSRCSVSLTMWIAEAFERVENISVEKLHVIVKTQGILDDLIETTPSPTFGYTNSPFVAQRLRALEENIRNLSSTMQFFVEEFNSIRSSATTSNGTTSNGTVSKYHLHPF